MIKILLINIVFCLTFFSQTVNCQPDKSIYIINYSWHTGFILKVDENLVEKLPALKGFENYNYVDIGWGDEEFYQHPDIDYYLAAKAILIPTSSALRVEGYNYEIDNIKSWSKFLVEFEISREQYLKLLDYIKKSFEITNDQVLMLSEKENGKVKFYRSNQYYHLFNTCNTWIAEGLKYAGVELKTNNVIQSEDLFREIKKTGKILKEEKTD